MYLNLPYGAVVLLVYSWWLKMSFNLKQWSWVLGSFAMLALLSLSRDDHGSVRTPPVRRELRSVSRRDNTYNQMLSKTDNQVVLNNGLVQLTFSYPGGDVIGIKYKGIDNLLDIKNQPSNRGYWDLVWNKPGEKGSVDKLQGTRFKVISATADQIEISFTKTYSPSLGNATVPLNVDKRYIMQRGRSGFYAYAIFERLKGWPEVDMDQIRIVYKLQQDKFRYMAISDDRKRVMPTADDRANGQPLAYPEAVLLTNPSNPEFRGEVDDKYQYSSEDKDNNVHGWICKDPAVGFWIITPSDEFRTAGPFKQDLTSHVGPTALSMFVSTHYAGKEVGMTFEDGEAWKKVFGPVFIHLNSAPSSNEYLTLWENAKEQLVEEVQRWPYNFTQSKDFLSSDQRGSVAGQLLVRDRYRNKRLIWASSAYVGLAAPGNAGSWQKESKGYQFWTQANKQGYFLIKDVRPGNYSLYATVPGFIGDYKYEANIIIEPGSEIKLADLTYEPPRNGPTLWEIGIPDRSAAEFNVPDPSPTLMNQLYTNHTEKFRQYGLWERYSDLYPNHDLIYTVGTDNYPDDWFFAHVTRNTGNQTYEPTTWQIRFQLNKGANPGSYTLQLALASATNAEVQVRVNDWSANPPHFTTGLIGKDNAIARHGIHGLYWLFSVGLQSDRLQEGNNTIYLTQSRHKTTFDGVMYDYLRLEGPPQE
ncbi:PREDICTED: probable rhamnogalacturonate lyase B [Prunus mume]|uniref:rhamnogalacturonan endolyase n=1 Tax=Prunus mume TaxID=102107 RepID=A0ABM0PA63_PRUMU|nr:PREDICTED: probable rhamnogalacturonate lyase B [Prunus mume]